MFSGMFIEHTAFFLKHSLLCINYQKSKTIFKSSRNSHVYWDTRKDLMQGKLFQRCTHLLYGSVLSLGCNVNTRRMSKPDMGSIFHINNQWNILVIGNYYVNYQNHQNSMLLTSSDTKRTLMHLFLFTNSARENWFQYVRRAYATAINFPCITFLNASRFYFLAIAGPLIS